jgi:hypothetical protein
MLDWMIDSFFAVLKSVPAFITDEGSANFMLVRAMLGLLLIILIICLVTFTPIRSMFADGIRKFIGLFNRNG